MAAYGSFGVLDYVFFVSTLVLSLLIGCYYVCVKRQKTNEDMLVGGRSMSVFPIALSLMATRLSANLIVGFSSEMYYQGTLILESTVVVVVWLIITGHLFLPVYMNLRLTSVYEYLELRFNCRTIRTFATLVFALQTVLYQGVVLFAPSVALHGVLDFPVWASIVCVGGCATIYASIGGLRAVVWTDAFQVFVYVGGLIAILVKGSMNVGGLGNALDIANQNGRIEFLNFSTDIFTNNTTLWIFFGQGLVWTSYYGCTQTLVQRYCSMSSLKKARRALYINIVLVVITMNIAGLVGLVIYANYATCDPLSMQIIHKQDQIATYFVADHLSNVPGFNGIFAASLYSGALSTLSSGLNSLAAVTWEDLSQIPSINKISEDKKVLIVKLLGIVYGLLSIATGFLSESFGGVLQATFALTGSVTGPLIGIFILALFMPFVNKKGALVGMVTGEAIALWICIGTLSVDTTPISLPVDNSDCETYMNDRNYTFIPNNTYVPAQLNRTRSELEWPEKLYTISYQLYPIVGAFITISLGIIVSVITGCDNADDKYLSPACVAVRKWYRKSAGKSDLKSAADATEYYPVTCDVYK